MTADELPADFADRVRAVAQRAERSEDPITVLSATVGILQLQIVELEKRVARLEGTDR